MELNLRVWNLGLGVLLQRLLTVILLILAQVTLSSFLPLLLHLSLQLQHLCLCEVLDCVLVSLDQPLIRAAATFAIHEAYIS